MCMRDRSVFVCVCVCVCLTLLVAQLLVLGPLACLVLVGVAVDGLVDRLSHFLLPTLRDHQREVLIQLLITVQQLRERKEAGRGR